MTWYDWINWGILLYFLLLNGTYLIMNIFAFFNIRFYYRLSKIYEFRRIYSTRFYKPISLLVPAHNEEKIILENVRSLLALDYPEFEVIVINDGSQDRTLAILEEAFELVVGPLAMEQKLSTEPVKAVYISKIEPRLLVVDKINGGKADALNAGINASSYPLFCAVDSDCILDKDGLLKVVRPFVENPRTIAAGGIIRIANGCKIEGNQVVEAGIPANFWAKFQVVEYLRAFLFGRIGWDGLNALLIISGAFGLFSKKHVIEAGGYQKETVGEDMELVVRLHRMMRAQKKEYKISFVPDPVCWTEVPEDISVLAQQRVRWHKGMADTLWRHRAMFFNPRCGWIGMFAYPYFTIFELFGPLVEVGGILFVIWSWWTGLVDWNFSILFFMVAVVLGVVLSLSSLVLEELFFHRYLGWRQVVVLAWYGILENFFYRQMHSLWRLKGLFQFLVGNRAWGEMTRKGFASLIKAKKQDSSQARGKWKLLAGLLIGILILLYPIISWQLRPAKFLNVALIDKTVPDKSYREHKGFVWLLNNRKYLNDQSQLPFKEQEDYYGFHPVNNQIYNVKDVPKDHLDFGLIYLADTYGVYTADYFKANNRGERSELIYGGTDHKDLAFIKKAINTQNVLVAEFNVLASPTSPEVRKELEALLQIKWTGWIGRYFTDLTSSNGEIPLWLKENYERQYSKPWDFKGPGITFVKDDSTVFVLEAGRHLGPALNRIVSTTETAREYGVKEEVKYYYWFEVMETTGSEVLASYVLDLTPEGKRLLDYNGIKESFPAIVRTQKPYQTYYFAGDFADNNGAPFFWKADFMIFFKRVFTMDLKGNQNYFYWNVYVPMMEKILDEVPDEQD